MLFLQTMMCGFSWQSRPGKTRPDNCYIKAIEYNEVWKNKDILGELSFHCCSRDGFVTSPHLYSLKQGGWETSPRFIRSLAGLERTRKVIPPPWYKAEGRMDPPPPSLSFWYVAVFRNDFAFSGSLILSTRWGILYGWWRCWRSVIPTNKVASLAAILDFIKN